MAYRDVCLKKWGSINDLSYFPMYIMFSVPCMYCNTIPPILFLTAYLCSTSLFYNVLSVSPILTGMVSNKHNSVIPKSRHYNPICLSTYSAWFVYIVLSLHWQISIIKTPWYMYIQLVCYVLLKNLIHSINLFIMLNVKNISKGILCHYGTSSRGKHVTDTTCSRLSTNY